MYPDPYAMLELRNFTYCIGSYILANQLSGILSASYTCNMCMADRAGCTSTLDWDLAGQASQTTVRYSFTDSAVPLCTRVFCDTCTYTYVCMYVRVACSHSVRIETDRSILLAHQRSVPGSLLYTQYIMGFLYNTHTSPLSMTVRENDDRSYVHMHKHAPSQGLVAICSQTMVNPVHSSSPLQRL